jgi:hypothetical protein
VPRRRTRSTYSAGLGRTRGRDSSHSMDLAIRKDQPAVRGLSPVLSPRPARVAFDRESRSRNRPGRSCSGTQPLRLSRPPLAASGACR